MNIFGITIFLVLFVFNPCFSQEANKLAYSEIVLIDSSSSQELRKAAIQWLDQNQFSNIDTVRKDAVLGENFFMVYQSGIATKQIHGKITYKTSIETKDNKYRYTFENFVFHFYQKDRNYNYVPTGRKKVLEDKDAQGWQKTWDKHKVYTSEKIESLSSKLKTDIRSHLRPSIKRAKKDDF